MTTVAAKMLRTRTDGLPVYGYEPLPGLPPVDTLALADALDSDGVPPSRAHAHDFFVVTYFEAAGGALRIGPRHCPVAAGDVYLIAPGDIVDVGGDVDGLRAARGRAVCFSPEALGPPPAGTLLSWRTHPLLFPFASAAGEPKRWNVPIADRADWSARLRAVDQEIRQRRHGHRAAVAAHLTLLLVGIARFARPPAGDTGLTAEPLLAEVLAYIDQRYCDRISLKDVARAVSLSPGHLTTVVGRKTGRTVQGWITQRRLLEACRLLVDTDLAVEEIGRRVGYRDPSHFIRTFRRAYGITPLGWRRAARSS